MKNIILVIFTALLAFSMLTSCGNQKTEVEVNTADTLVPPVVNHDSLAVVKIDHDSMITHRSNEILAALKAKDFKTFARFMHPVRGTRFSPNGFVDTINNQKWTGEELVENINLTKVFFWGIADGTGDSILLTTKAYFNRNVYPKDFLQAPQHSINKRLGKGNSPNNIAKVYPLAEYTESYFPKFEDQYEGMDWQSLRLVLEMYQGQFYLVGLVHDHWTI